MTRHRTHAVGAILVFLALCGVCPTLIARPAHAATVFSNYTGVTTDGGFDDPGFLASGFTPADNYNFTGAAVFVRNEKLSRPASAGLDGALLVDERRRPGHLAVDQRNAERERPIRRRHPCQRELRARRSCCEREWNISSRSTFCLIPSGSAADRLQRRCISPLVGVRGPTAVRTTCNSNSPGLPSRRSRNPRLGPCCCLASPGSAWHFATRRPAQSRLASF